ncbi:uncharacterized protein LOC110670479 [Hevea brasiliensis]|uniref:uncharacterized protein LOC110670479 n=1 Tax=Hevea brasiliensis TaxID=3981 RepID=UPI0025DA82E0|nr:uncharacterized protein LOC110670479 [Hevea brasiliensis]
MEAQLGRRPFPCELFHKTHTRKGTSDMVDARAQSIKDAFLVLKEQLSQPQKGCSDPPTIDEVTLYYHVRGGGGGERITGFMALDPKHQFSTLAHHMDHLLLHPIVLSRRQWRKRFNNCIRLLQHSRIVWLQWRREIDNAS